MIPRILFSLLLVRLALVLLGLALLTPLRALTIAVNDPAIAAGISPATWQRNGATSIKTVNGGAYVKFNFTGTSIGLTVDVSSLSGYTAGRYPVLKYTVDGSRVGSRQLTSSDTTITLLSGLADTTHTFRLDVIALDQDTGGDRWLTPTMCVTITGFVIDTGKVVITAPRLTGGWMLIYGDSISEGAVTLAAKSGGNEYAQIADSTRGYQVRLAQLLNMEYGNVAFSGGGWSSGVSNYPGLVTAWNYLFNGVSRDFTAPPDVVTCNMGYNGTVSAATVTAWLTAVRAAVGPRCFILLITTFAQVNYTAINGGYADYMTANPTDGQTALADLGIPGSAIVSANTYGDGVHPTPLGHDLLFLALRSSIRSNVSPGNPEAAYAGN